MSGMAIAYSIRPANATASWWSPARRAFKPALPLILAMVAAGCGSIHAGWPGIPISVGIPLRGLSQPKPFTVALTLETEPSGADVQLDGRLVGTSPTVVHLVFKRTFTGGCKAEPVHRLLVVKAGYQPEGLSYTCQLAWDLSEGPSNDRRLSARLRLVPEW